MPIESLAPGAIAWTAPSILLSAMLIAWAAESAQFFVAQGFALAILAWLQTLPEFAVEAVLAWKQQVPLLLANLTGALRLLTGLGWPMIYATAAVAHRWKTRQPLRRIALEPGHCIEVVGLLACMAYAAVIWLKGTLNLLDAGILIAIYAAYLVVLQRMPPEKAEGIEDLELIPRSIVKSRRPVRIGVIAGLFLTGGALIYFTAEPFLGSLLSLSAVLGIPSFVFVQWVAPFVSEFPEKVSAFYWARTVDRASMAHGLEVRVPILDHRIVELGMSLPAELSFAGDGGKPLLRRLADQHMPASLRGKAKRGFSFPLQRVASVAAMTATVQYGALSRAGLLDAAGFRRWCRDDTRSNHDYKLWLLFVLEHWARQWLLASEKQAA